MGGAIARGLSTCDLFRPQDITVINRRASKTAEIQEFNPELQAVTGDYSSLATAYIVVIAVKPWIVEALIKEHLTGKRPDGQIVISVAAGIFLEQLQTWAGKDRALYCAIPNTAIEVKQSMTFITGLNATEDQNRLVLNIFGALGKAELVEERLLGPATTPLLLRYRLRLPLYPGSDGGRGRAGPYPQKAREGVLQTLRGAIDLLESNGSHPEQEVDRVTTAGGITIKAERNGTRRIHFGGDPRLKASNNG